MKVERVAQDLHPLAASPSLVGDQTLYIGSVLGRLVGLESVALPLVHQHNLLGPPLGSAGSNTFKSQLLCWCILPLLLIGCNLKQQQEQRLLLEWGWNQISARRCKPLEAVRERP